ncbi:MAG TPA: XamI family restriction endonuclease [Chloroflexota bacterium]|jgi:hypothetical protein
MPQAGPIWTADQLEADRLASLELFRRQRMKEPLEAYLQAFDKYRCAVERLLQMTDDLTAISNVAAEVLSEPVLLDAARYLASPPISMDDLRVLSEASLAPARIRADNALAHKIMDTVLLGLDGNRFPWVLQRRDPTDAERSAAVLASAALIASNRVVAERRAESNVTQETAVADALRGAGLREMPRRTIANLDDAPARGEFCGESVFAGRKADLVIRLWDGRAMPMECKVSNSYVNSVKRLNNDAAVKAGQWLHDFGSVQTVPAALLAGVFKLANLEQAQQRGLTIFWSHGLDALVHFVEGTRDRLL